MLKINFYFILYLFLHRIQFPLICFLCLHFMNYLILPLILFYNPFLIIHHNHLIPQFWFTTHTHTDNVLITDDLPLAVTKPVRTKHIPAKFKDYAGMPDHFQNLSVITISVSNRYISHSQLSLLSCFHSFIFSIFMCYCCKSYSSYIDICHGI